MVARQTGKRWHEDAFLVGVEIDIERALPGVGRQPHAQKCAAAEFVLQVQNELERLRR